MKQLLAVLIALLLMGLVACEGPQGPEGKEGPQGPSAGFVYFDGFKDSLKCATCHNPDADTVYYMAGKKLQWEQSVHGSGSAYSEARGGTSECGACHTTEGFMMKVAGKTLPADGLVDPTRPGCFACHSPHSRGDFSLRTTEPVTLPSNIVGVADASFDKGNANLCVACHHPRSVNPKPDPTKTAATDTITITSSRWYAHYGVQGQILIGAGAFQFVDAASYTSTTAHSSGLIETKGCPTCHMAYLTPVTELGGLIGGHTMRLEHEGTEMTNGCKNCHSSITTLDYNGKQTQVTALMDSLKVMLVAKGWINASNAIQATSGSPLKITPASRAGALFNYMLLLHDGSKGVHNPSYAISMLNASIAELNK